MGTKYFRNTKSYKGLFLGTQKIIRPVAVTFSLVTSTTPTTGSIPMPPPIYERKLLDNISKKVAAGVEILHCEWFAILSYPSLLLLVETEKGNNGSGCRHDRIDTFLDHDASLCWQKFPWRQSLHVVGDAAVLATTSQEFLGSRTTSSRRSSHVLIVNIMESPKYSIILTTTRVVVAIMVGATGDSPSGRRSSSSTGSCYGPQESVFIEEKVPGRQPTGMGLGSLSIRSMKTW